MSRPDAARAHQSLASMPAARRRTFLGLSEHARLLYVISLLIADDNDSVTKTAMEDAVQDPQVIELARAIASEWSTP